jgi:hypothetical protein
MIEAALGQGAEIERVPAFWNGEEEILRLVSKGSGAPAAVNWRGWRSRRPAGVLPDWLHRAARYETNAMPPVRPSKAREVLTGRTRSARDWHKQGSQPRRGRLIHQLLQYLPGVAAQHRRDAALLPVRPERLASGKWCAKISPKSTEVIDLPELAGLFEAGSESRGIGYGPDSAWAADDRYPVPNRSDKRTPKRNSSRRFQDRNPCALDDTPPADYPLKWHSIVPFWLHSGQTKPCACC